jgi:hypothetical protein
MPRKPLSEKITQLYHYTSVDALEGIHRTRKIWATRFSDMNDGTEQQRFQEIAIRFAQPILTEVFTQRSVQDPAFGRRLAEGGGNRAVSEREARLHVSKMHQSIFGDFEGPFIASFCAHDTGSFESMHGLLSQWRGYGSKGGVAIVFSTADIESLMDRERAEFAHAVNHLGEVIYEHDENRIQADLRDYFEHVPNILRDFYGTVQPAYELVFDAFVRGTTLVKHRAFHEEQEIRIVVCPRTRKRSSVFYDPQHETLPLKPINHRRRLDGEARYVELFGGAPLPISRVIVGPSRIQNVNCQRVAEVLKGTGISVDVSSTPYIE